MNTKHDEHSMSHEKTELFLHGAGEKPKKVSAGREEFLIDVLAKSGINAADVPVFVGEWTEALNEEADVENGNDTQEPVNATQTLEQLKIRNHEHIHCHKCHRIATGVNYGSQTKRHQFSPATTIEVVTKWAKKKLMLDDAAAADLVLQICGTTDRPRPNQHLGEIVETGSCEICFDLVPEVTPQG